MTLIMKLSVNKQEAKDDRGWTLRLEKPSTRGAESLLLEVAYSLIRLRTAGIVFGSISLRPKLSVADLALSTSVIGPPSSNDK